MLMAYEYINSTVTKVLACLSHIPAAAAFPHLTGNKKPNRLKFVTSDNYKSVAEIVMASSSAENRLPGKIYIVTINHGHHVETSECLINEIPGLDSSLRWLHIPANNMAWVEECFKKCKYKLDRETWKPKVRPALSGSIAKALHSRHMEPTCELHPVAASTNGPSRADGDTQSSTPQLTLYLPYMNWDTYKDYKSLRGIYDCYEKPEPRQPPTPPDKPSQREKFEHGLFQYLSKGLHPRRTLDQFYYPSLNDTSARDADQTISKWTGNGLSSKGKRQADDDSLLIMIDQLWCWVLDDQTVLSCFPSHDSQIYAKHYAFHNLYDSIQQRINKCETAWDMHSLLIREATTFLFSQENRKLADLIETYRWVTSKKAADQTTYFQEFQNPTDEEPSLDNRRELNLVLEVADIIDELKMIRHLFDKQREILRSSILALAKRYPSNDQPPNQPLNVFTINNPVNMTIHLENRQGISYGVENTELLARGVRDPAREHINYADKLLALLLTEINTINNDAEYTHKMLLDLLDLKQKTASLAEARATTQQGRAVMLFTIVTIIFLPLSFFTSYFGQNVSEITGDDKNPSTWDLWRIGTPISLVIILLALLFAFYITKPSSRLWCWRHRRQSQDQDSSA